MGRISSLGSKEDGIAALRLKAVCDESQKLPSVALSLSFRVYAYVLQPEIGCANAGNDQSQRDTYDLFIFYQGICPLRVRVQEPGNIALQFIHTVFLIPGRFAIAIPVDHRAFRHHGPVYLLTCSHIYFLSLKYIFALI